jgi:hypothetical protein
MNKPENKPRTIWDTRFAGRVGAWGSLKSESHTTLACLSMPTAALTVARALLAVPRIRP